MVQSLRKGPTPPYRNPPSKRHYYDLKRGVVKSVRMVVFSIFLKLCYPLIHGGSICVLETNRRSQQEAHRLFFR